MEQVVLLVLELVQPPQVKSQIDIFHPDDQLLDQLVVVVRSRRDP